MCSGGVCAGQDEQRDGSARWLGRPSDAEELGVEVRLEVRVLADLADVFGRLLEDSCLLRLLRSVPPTRVRFPPR